MKILQNIFLAIILANSFNCFGQGQFEYNKGVKFEVYKGTEKDIKNYLDKHKTDPIEGIWSANSSGIIGDKDYKNENLIKFAIIKDSSSENRDFIQIFISASDPAGIQTLGWKQYYIFGSIDKTSAHNVYLSQNYESAVKVEGEPNSTNCYLDENGLLTSSKSFWSNGIKIEMKETDIKIYPLVSFDSKPLVKSEEFTGSGFFITSNGVIATNYHVVADAKVISIQILKDGKSITYNAKTFMVDKTNDIALLKIDDENFQPFLNIPYVIKSKADIGENVFTIGFPLNDIMGQNFKLTNGIISSSSGILDDIRYYQITVPIQPGNSGGPLFNENGDIVGLTTGTLSEEKTGIKLQNTNYAIKSNYLLVLAEMAGIKEQLAKQNKIVSKILKDQVEILKKYVCLIHVTT